MQKNKIRVGIIGCGMIFDRHIEAINSNSDHFVLVSICDIDKKKVEIRAREHGIPGFENYREMLQAMKGKMDMVSICTPNSFHFLQAEASLNFGYDVLIEKPVDFESKRVKKLVALAEENSKKAYCVLQVRYNPTVKLLKIAIDQGMVGDIRSVSLVQRWQRPSTYFDSWRADIDIGGRTLYEVGIHYLDIIQFIFGLPSALSSATFNNKHRHVKFEDTIFSILKFNDGFSGSVEVTIAAEPCNLECSLSVMGSEGYIKVGGRALDLVEKTLFSNRILEEKWNNLASESGESLEPNSYGTHSGSCPNHPTLYREIGMGTGIELSEAINSIKFIESIYESETKQ
ncbi:MAG: oxidoreductase domain-containing protein [Candidatus Nomurabacteria bacterium GW2011_GWB1_37_5]|uniref:Oxidoreductase domain-containing protein n=1 Tax=Candidatus Nomurabacteria bacterium GW2011_GWB1_37_5 TaxID=1618742 RepID=A0A0G0H9E7_9BACT|nr:MAG: oxidoreductase domain-containing protein [Candidatus Nomurabacteria bacterium GW2011_GWB1_37_5]